MAKGGYRPGAGRPKGAKNISKESKTGIPRDIQKAARKSGLTPLDYMLTVMNDEKSDDNRRDRMAVAAAPFVHAKAEAADASKKAQRQATAEKSASEGKFAAPGAPKLVVSN